MSQAHEINLFLQNLDLNKYFDSIGLIYLENKYYLVCLCPSDCSDNKIKYLNFQEVTQFEINQKRYLVLQEKPTSDVPEKNVELTNILTSRELQIAILVALGQQNKHIAKQLKISEWTVSAHLRRIFTKLGVGSRAAMVYKCSSLIYQNRNFECESNMNKNSLNKI
jgi:DNA-binding CsgD family transcriptional regulator